MEHQRTGVLVPRSQKTIKENPGLNRIFFSAKAGETKDVYLRIYNEFGPGHHFFTAVKKSNCRVSF